MTKLQRARLKRSQHREKVNHLLGIEDRTEEQEVELRERTDALQKLEVEYRAAILLDNEEGETRAAHPDAEMRERVELRSNASLTNFFLNAARGRLASGAEAELQAAAGVGDGIPIELWDTETRAPEERAVAGAPGTVGLNLDPIRPAVFANSIAPRLGIDMPRVESGTYASATISTSQTAAPLDKGGEAMATAAGFTVTTATPKRVSARLGIAIEDVASVGQANYESMLRENLSLVISDELDDQLISGNGTAPNLAGIFSRLTDPSDTPTAVAKFDDFVGKFCAGVDGLWASRTNEVAIVAGPETYRLSAKTFRDGPTDDRGDMAFSDYAMAQYGGWWTNSRMPAKVSHIQQAILHRKGRMGMRTAVCPHWNEISIDDIYSGSAKGERFYTMHVLLGDVILVQPSSYGQVQFRVST